MQKRLGHCHVSITLGIYSHVSPTLHHEAAEQVAALLLVRRRLIDRMTVSPAIRLRSAELAEHAAGWLPYALIVAGPGRI